MLPDVVRLSSCRRFDLAQRPAIRVGSGERGAQIVVGLVQAYSNKSQEAVHLRNLAALEGSRPAALAPRRLPKRARQLTDGEKAAFVEGYGHGEGIREMAEKLGVHRTTLDALAKRLGLSREDPRALPAEIRAEIVRRYRAGDTLAALGQELGLGPNRVQRVLAAEGEEVRARGQEGSKLTVPQIEEAVRAYESGTAMVAIAARFGVSYACARGALIGAGTELRPRGGAR